MLKYLALSTAIVAGAFMLSNKANASESANANEAKVLIAYYSYSGNTKKVAEAIHEKIGGDLFEIKDNTVYPEKYREMTQQAKEEIANGYRPKLTDKVQDISKYDVIFLGSPNWWSTITPQVSSFIESYDLSGKQIVPFITHGSGGVQNTVKTITEQCKGCIVNDNPWVGYSSRTFGISGWLEDLGFKK